MRVLIRKTCGIPGTFPVAQLLLLLLPPLCIVCISVKKSNSCDPKFNGQKAPTSDCRSYYECDNSEIRIRTCPRGQALHRIWRECVWEGQVEGCFQGPQQVNTTEVECGKVDLNGDFDVRKESPWTVAVFQRSKTEDEWEYMSPGVILSPTTILSTCRLGRLINGRWRTSLNATAFRVIAGSSSLDERAQDEYVQTFQVLNVLMNPKNKGKSYDYCSVIMQLSSPINFATPFAKAACLPLFDVKAEKGATETRFPLGYSGHAVMSNYAEVDGASDGYPHLNTRLMKLTGIEFCYAHLQKWNAYCGVEEPGGDRIVETCMTHNTVTMAESPKKNKYYLAGFGSNFDNEVCKVRKVADDDHMSWIKRAMKCSSDSFPCNDGSCIPLKNVCNSNKDCPKGEDEEASMCRSRNPCINDATFQCGVYENCIKPTQVCNGYPDCYDASDEDTKICAKITPRKNLQPFYLPPTTEKPVAEFAPGLISDPPEGSPQLDAAPSVQTPTIIPSLPPPDATLLQQSTLKQPATCPRLETSEGVSVKCTHAGDATPRDCASGEISGTVATFTCNTFYKPVAFSGKNLLRICNSNGTWKPEKPFECLPDCGRIWDTSSAFIAHGQSVSPKENFPWHIAIFRKKDATFKYICGGTLIRRSFLLTAAHCVSTLGGNGAQDPENFKVVLSPTSSIFADAQQDRPENILDVKKIVVNEHFDPGNNYQSDLAILYLSKPIALGPTLGLACLPDRDQSDLFPTTLVKVPGFGLNENATLSDSLRFATLPIVKTEECIQLVKFIPSVNQLCAGYTNGTGVCYGDSGGGLVVQQSGRYFIRGIVSVGPTTITKKRRRRSSEDHHSQCNTVSVFTDVVRFVDWILDEINVMELDT